MGTFTSCSASRPHPTFSTEVTPIGTALQAIESKKQVGRVAKTRWRMKHVWRRQRREHLSQCKIQPVGVVRCSCVHATFQPTHVPNSGAQRCNSRFHQSIVELRDVEWVAQVVPSDNAEEVRHDQLA